MFAIGLCLVLFALSVATSKSTVAKINRSEVARSFMGGLVLLGVGLMAMSIIVALWRLLP